MLALATILLGLAALTQGTTRSQVRWVEVGRKFLTAWNAGRIDLLAPTPRARPRLLDPSKPKIAELVRARGERFFWSEEAELGFVCTGLAATIGEEAGRLLFELGRVHGAATPEKEWTARASRKKQPWLVRNHALAAIANGNDARLPRLARGLLGAKSATRPFDLAFACALLGRRHDAASRATIEPLLAAESARTRVAALYALGRIASPSSFPKLLGRLANEHDTRVRCALWDALARCVAGLGAPGSRPQSSDADAAIDAALERLGDKTAPLIERIATCRFLWTARPLRALRRLPKLLAAESIAHHGHAVIRSWIWGLLEDMHGTGTNRSISTKSGRLGTGFTAGEDEPEKWAAFLAKRRRLFALDRGRDAYRPQFAANAPRFLGLPIAGKRITFLIDRSAAGAAQWSKSKSSPSVFGKLTTELVGVLSELPATTEVRLLAYAKTAVSWPRRGFGRLDDHGIDAAKRFLAGLKPSGRADHASTLFATCGLHSALPIELSTLGEDAPDTVVWLVTSAPLAGPMQSIGAIVDAIIAAQASHPLPFHVAYFQDRAKHARGSPVRAMVRGLSRPLRRLGQETHGGYVYCTSSPRKR